MENNSKDTLKHETNPTDKSFVCNYPFMDTSLPLEERVKDLVSRLTIDEKLSLLPTRQAAVERLGIKEYHIGGEAAHGLVAHSGTSTVFPQPAGLACSWNVDLLAEIGSAIGDEARVYYKKNREIGGLTLWAPTIDMERDPRWGRTEEAYGEDPCLAGKLSAALIKGMQGDHPFYLKMVAAPKHFYANNNEKYRICGSSSVDPRNKFEYYLKPFKIAFTEGGALSMMTAYNRINGIPAMLNSECQSLVKDEWGMKGFIVTDGGAVSQVVDHHKYYKQHYETVAEALRSGVDCFTDKADFVVESLNEAVKRGILQEEVIDKALRNIFRIRFRLGQFDYGKSNPYENISEGTLNCKKHRELSLRAAREAIVLLKNDRQTLPLEKSKIAKVAVLGPLANAYYRDWYTGIPHYKVTPLEAIQRRLEECQVVYTKGCDTVTIKSAMNNRYLAPESLEGKDLKAECADQDERTLFEVEDWGWGSASLKSLHNGKYVTSEDNGDISVSANEVWGWKVKELFDLIPVETGAYKIKTWNNRCLSVPTGRSGYLSVGDTYSVKDKYEASAEEIFHLNTVKNGLDEAYLAAKSADVAVVFVGNHPLINGKEEDDRTDITLPPYQEQLIKSVYKANKNTVVVVVSSYPYAISQVNDLVPAILYTSHGSQEIGNAIADVLFGDCCPAGRLNMTWYSSIDQLPDMHEYDIIKSKRTYMYFEGKSLYPFGYGLTYADFSYGGLKINPPEAHLSDEILISLDVKNLSGFSSDEVVQLYVSSYSSRVKRPVKELKGFKRLKFEPMQTQTISFVLSARDLEFWDVTRNKYCVETGKYEIMIGRSSEDIRLIKTIEIRGEAVPYRDLGIATRAENYDDYFGVRLDECTEGGTCISFVEEGDWIAFHDVDFKECFTAFEARAACDSRNSSIELRLDSLEGNLIGLCNIASTGGWQSWETYKCSINMVEGVHRLFLRFNGPLNLSWFRLIKEEQN